LYNGQILNIENLARESSVKRTTAERYFQILEETLLATRVPAITLGIRTKESSHPKFFLFDTGLARAAAGLVMDDVDPVWKGFAFEALVLHEMRAYNSMSGKARAVFHYSVSGGFDVDFLIQTKPKTLSSPRKLIAVEVKSAKTYRSDWITPLRTLRQECAGSVERTIVVYQGNDHLRVDGVEVWPASLFFEALHAGQIF
jgi:predicted AAA+ superfamily ATPase